MSEEESKVAELVSPAGEADQEFCPMEVAVTRPFDDEFVGAFVSREHFLPGEVVVVMPKKLADYFLAATGLAEGAALDEASQAAVDEVQESMKKFMKESS